MITDAICSLPGPMVDRFVAWKREAKARVIALVLNNPPGDLVRVADECNTIADINAEELAIGRVLSL